jgi:excisionase family DNA binding protein
MENGTLNDSYKDKEFVSTTEIAAYLHVSRVTVFKWIKKGDLPASFFSGSYMISLRDLETHLKREVNFSELTKNRAWVE